MKGLFISFEGPEGSGKSTQARHLAERLRTMGHVVAEGRDPGSSATGEAIRGILQHDTAGEPIEADAELLLFVASRAQAVRRLIRPALARGEIVISDRFVDSSVAYQGHGRGCDLEQVQALNTFAVDGTWPDVTVLLDVSIEEGFERIRARNRAAGLGEDRFEREDMAFHERVREGYLELAVRYPERIRAISGAASTDEVFERVWAVISPLVVARGDRHEG